MSGLPTTSIPRHQREPSCSAILIGHLADARRQGGLTLNVFAKALAAAYNDNVPEGVRGLELVEPDETMTHARYASLLGRIVKRVQRYIDGDAIPVELLDAWVDALIDVAPEHGSACGQAVARRLGFVGARMPVATPAADQQMVGRYFGDVGRATAALTRALEDEVLDASDLVDGTLEREMARLHGLVAEVEARIAQIRAADSAGVARVE